MKKKVGIKHDIRGKGICIRKEAKRNVGNYSI
jgi:hypothetical protein